MEFLSFDSSKVVEIDSTLVFDAHLQNKFRVNQQRAVSRSDECTSSEKKRRDKNVRVKSLWNLSLFMFQPTHFRSISDRFFQLFFSATLLRCSSLILRIRAFDVKNASEKYKRMLNAIDWNGVNILSTTALQRGLSATLRCDHFGASYHSKALQRNQWYSSCAR